MRIWINPTTNDELRVRLIAKLAEHEIVDSISNAEVIYGRTAPENLTSCIHVKWIHVDAAGYEKFDTSEIRSWATSSGIPVSNSSAVYAEPCAQHVLAMMLAVSRDLMASWKNQSSSREWPMLPIRARSTLLLESRVLLLGYGAIAKRLVELLAPFSPEVVAFRRTKSGSGSSVQTIQEDKLDEYLGWANHIVNLLPSNPSTQSFVDERKLQHFKSDSIYYSIGRGVTTDQDALANALRTGKPRLAYLDVTDPEPLPEDHELWRIPNCLITPHTAGGHVTEPDRLIAHFLNNLKLFEAGDEIRDRIF
jgi:phosphoglycerate dehydrogenase-like enzyme